MKAHRINLSSRNSTMMAAIVLSSLMWSVGHWGALEPYGLKLMQTFVLGCVLGLTAWCRGLEVAILLHWIYNVSLIPISGMLESLIR